METSKPVAYAAAALIALLMVAALGRLKWPSWIYFVLSAACFFGALLVIELLHPWSASTPWPNAIKAGLVGLTGGLFGIGIRTNRLGHVGAA